MKNQKGITLVALVVTIVVLLILAGITIMYVLQGDSIFKAANDAKDATSSSSAQEVVAVALWSVQTDVYNSKGKIATARNAAAEGQEDAKALEAANKILTDDLTGNVDSASITLTHAGTDGITVAANSYVIVGGVKYDVTMDTKAAEPVPLSVEKHVDEKQQETGTGTDTSTEG